LSLIRIRPATSMPVLGQLVDLGEQRLWIDDHTVADHADDAGVEGSRTESGAAELVPFT